MTARRHSHDLIAQLPATRGGYSAGVSLADLTWFRVGGPAEVLFKPVDVEDLAHFLRERPRDLPLTVIGVGSNLLVRDGGIPGVTIRLGKGFGSIAVDGESIKAGGGASDVAVALAAQRAGLAGLEFLRGIPGTIGGGLRMNAGAYGSEMRDVLIAAEALDGEGQLHQLSLEDMGFGYRHCSIPADWIFTGARLKARPGDAGAIAARMAEIQASRETTQPIKSATGGSTFANPPGRKAWELIDAAGCRGLVIGDAQVSEQHCNFLINRGNASAADLENLGETVRRRVFEASGIDLHWEIRRIGVPAVSNENLEVPQ
ncbi:UDP-N-acetylmuramate dehydrogenase [Ferrovibrio sp.]|uniref:UDP-N-acetylmuramate dehydrogenase n=1 Tax=Ferrovibrio sp. TaxID=1917215 RepID=UPI0025B94A59|nr:UDP-N-acetylmuramate dehydrogenase [Ferrovibrio sp.]MBX3455780.1 UDP-N-acetylmuramate dehydrogenase [Ferrovibrio sp.]